MMATNKIKGITVEIGGDTTKLTKALDSTNKTSRDLQSELKQVDRLLQFDPTNVELLTQKQEILTEQIANTSNKLKTLKDAQAQVQAQFERGEIGADQYRAFQREILSTESRLEELQATLKKTNDELDGIGTNKAKSTLESLTDTIKKQESELKSLQCEYTNVVLSQGKGSDEAKALASKIQSLNSELNENKTKLSAAETETKLLTISMDDLGDEAKDTEKGFTIMKGALADLVSNGIQTVISKGTEFVGTLFSMTESTEEYRSMMSKVEGSATNFGYSIEYAKDRYKEFYSYLKDDQMATNAITNLMGLKVQTETLDQLVNGAISTWTAYGDSIPIESLTESINETIQVSKVTGVMADTINWAKISNEQWNTVLGKGTKAREAFTKAVKDGEAVEDAFSAALAATTDEQERANIVAKFLNQTYGKSKDIYDDLNEAVLEANKAESELKETQAELGETLQPLQTKFTKLKNQALKEMTPAIKDVTNEFEDLIDGIDWRKAGNSIGNLLETAGEGVKFLLENLEPISAVVAGVATAWGVYKATQLASNGVTAIATGLMAAQTTAVVANTVATEGATLATKALSLAQMATPWGLLAGLIGGAVVAIGTYVAMSEDSTKVTNENVEATNELVDSYDDLNKTLEESKEARKEAIEDVEVQGATAQKLSEKIESLSKVEDKSNGQKKLMAEYVSQLNELMPELNLQYDEEKDKLNLTTEAIREKINANKELMKAQAMQEMLGDILKEQVEVELELAKAQEQQKANEEELYEAKKKTAEAMKEWQEAGMPYTGQIYRNYVDAAQAEAQLQKAYDDSIDLVDELTGSVSALDDEYKSVEETANNIIDSQEIEEKLTAITEACKAKGVEIPEAIAEGIRSGQYAVPQSVSEMQSLISYQSMIDKATSSGMKLPESLTNGIKSGQTKPSEAVKQMDSLVSFNDLLNKAGIAGEQVPDQLAQKVAEGKLKPADAVKQMNNLVEFNDLLSKSEIAGATVPKEIQDAILSGKMKPADAMKAVKQNIVDTINSIQGQMKTAGNTMITALKSGMNAKKGDVTKEAKSIADSGASTVKNAKSQYKLAGGQLVSGISSGVNSNSSIATSAIGSLASSMLARFKQTLQIKSPSRVFKKEAGFVPLGAAAGIDENSQIAVDSVDKMVNDMIDESKRLNDIQVDPFDMDMNVNKPDFEAMQIERQISVKTQDTNILNRLYDMLADALPRLENMQLLLDGDRVADILTPRINSNLGVLKERGSRS